MVSVLDPMGNCSDASKNICSDVGARHFALNQQHDGWTCGYRSLYILLQVHRTWQQSGDGILVRAYDGTFRPRPPPAGWIEFVWELLRLRLLVEASNLPDDPDYVFMSEFRTLQYDDANSVKAGMSMIAFYETTISEGIQ